MGGAPRTESAPGNEADLQRTACHEAGHAVAARALGFEVEYVTVTATAAGRGACKIKTPTWLRQFEEAGPPGTWAVSRLDRAEVASLIVQKLAGPAAVTRRGVAQGGPMVEHLALLTHSIARGAWGRRVAGELEQWAGAPSADTAALTERVARAVGDCGSDARDARDLARALSAWPEEGAALVERQWRRACGLIEESWSEIEAVEAALVAGGSLSGDDLREVLRRAERDQQAA
jgi:hypothetical protein